MGRASVPTPTKLRMRKVFQGVSAAGKSRGTKGKQPGPSAKVPKLCLVGKEVRSLRQLGGWLRSSHPLKIA